MSAGWVAGSVRGRLLTRRRLGVAGARAVATSGSAEAAIARLADSPYGPRVHSDMSITEARRAIGAVCVWHLRVLAGWLPPRAGDAVRVFAARFELVDLGDRFGTPTGERPPEPYALGTLAVAWPRIEGAATAAELRAALGASAWGDPGTTVWSEAAVVFEARWTSWLAESVPGRAEWAQGAAALVAARQLASGQPMPAAAAIDLRRQLGHAWEDAIDVRSLAARLPSGGRWVLAGIDEPSDLWRSEGRWWRRVDDDAARLLRRERAGPRIAAAAAARLVADAWWAQAALEAAAWGAGAVEVFDAVA